MSNDAVMNANEASIIILANQTIIMTALASMLESREMSDILIAQSEKCMILIQEFTNDLEKSATVEDIKTAEDSEADHT
jgi:2-C-methyl-D-erythritol 4-phosphate cytidylyltransferase